MMNSSPTAAPKAHVNRLLDASALLAFLLEEPGLERVSAAMVVEGAFISSVNLAEVAARLSDLGNSEATVAGMLRLPKLEVLTFGGELAMTSAHLRPATRPLGLALGDRACLATALAAGLPVLTADRTWAQLDIGVAVEVIR